MPFASRQGAARRLWCAVILQALYEAAGRIAYAEKGERDRLQNEAVAWFVRGGHDFDAVCHLAGLDPAAVRTSALNVLRRPKLRRKRR